MKKQTKSIYASIQLLIRIATLSFILLFLAGCESRFEEITSEVNDLLEKEKYETAHERLILEMKKVRPGDRELSGNKPANPRILLITSDRKKAAWVEDDAVFAWDIEKDNIEESGLDAYPDSFSISANGKFALVTLPLKKNQGCRMEAISLYDGSLKYESGAHVSCKNGGSISNDGKFIYYFIDENIYFEQTSDPKKPEILIKRSEITPPYEKLKNRLVMVPVDDNFIFFYGIGGSYSMYMLYPEKKSVKKLATEIMSPDIIFFDENSGYVLSGTIGKMKLKKVDYSSGKVSAGFAIGDRELNAWPTDKKDEFISGDSDGVYLWTIENKPQQCPVLYHRFWGLGNKLIYENDKRKLFLTDIRFIEQEWNLVDLLKQVKKKL